jgi:hypothetical protein
MSNNAREIFERAFEMISDERRELDQREHQQWLDRHAVELENQECDALLARLDQRRELKTKDYDDRDLVFKTTWSPLPPQATTNNDDWNAWARSHCDLVRAELRAEIAELREDLKFYTRDGCGIVADEAGQHIRRFEERLTRLETALFEKALRSAK